MCRRRAKNDPAGGPHGRLGDLQLPAGTQDRRLDRHEAHRDRAVEIERDPRDTRAGRPAKPLQGAAKQRDRRTSVLLRTVPRSGRRGQRAEETGGHWSVERRLLRLGSGRRLWLWSPIRARLSRAASCRLRPLNGSRLRFPGRGGDDGLGDTGRRNGHAGGHMSAHAHHFVPTALKFVGNPFDDDVMAGGTRLFGHEGDIRRRFSAQGEEREDAHFAGGPAQLRDGRTVEILAKVFRVEKQEVRAQREVEGGVGERKRRQRRLDVPAFRLAGVEVVQKRPHRLHADAAELLHRRDRRPDEFVRVLARLREDLVVGRGDAPAKLDRRELVDRIAGDDVVAAARGFGIEARRSVAAPEDVQLEVGVREREHPPVFVERSPPRHDLIESEHDLPYNFRVPSSLLNPRSNVPSGRCPAFRAISSIRQSENPTAGRLENACNAAATTSGSCKMSSR